MPETQLTPEWHPGYVFFSYVAAALASYATLALLQQQRPSIMLTAVAAFTLSVCGIWSMHFVGMEAMSLGIAVEFDAALTILSAVFAFLCVAVAFLILQRTVNAPTLQQQLGVDAATASALDALRDAPHVFVVLAAMFVAAGVCSMHYTGQVAMRSVARAEANVAVIVGSVFVAILASIVAAYLAFVLPTTRPHWLASSIAMAGAVCTTHYMGMHGFTYYVDTTTAAYAASAQQPRTRDTGFFVLGASTLLSFIVLAYALLRHQRALVDVLVVFERYVPATIVNATLTEQGDHHDDDATPEPAMTRTASAHSDHEHDDGAKEFDHVGSNPLSPHGDDHVAIDAPSASPKSAKHRRATKAVPASYRVNMHALRMRRCFCTVAHVEMVSFAAAAEGLLDDALMVAMTNFNTYCEGVVGAHGGVVDRFTGDGLVATWNAITPSQDHAVNAARAAVTITRQPKSVFPCRVGIQTGSAMVGNVGSETKLAFTAVGEAVTQAGKAIGLARHYGVAVLVGDVTARFVGATAPGSPRANLASDAAFILRPIEDGATSACAADAGSDAGEASSRGGESSRGGSSTGSRLSRVNAPAAASSSSYSSSLPLTEIMALHDDPDEVTTAAIARAEAYKACVDLFRKQRFHECVRLITHFGRSGGGGDSSLRGSQSRRDPSADLGGSNTSDAGDAQPRTIDVSTDGSGVAPTSLERGPLHRDGPTRRLLGLAVKELALRGDPAGLRGLAKLERQGQSTSMSMSRLNRV